MSGCESFRTQILEAAPADLRVGGAGPLADHLRSCKRCRAAADAVLAADRELDEALSVDVPAAADVEAILLRAGLRGARPGSGAVPMLRRRRRSRAWGWAVTTLAAAGLAGLLLTRGRPASLPPSASKAPQRALPLLADASARQVAVMPTDDPDITVLWFFPEE